jgi:hypothetical protein
MISYWKITKKYRWIILVCFSEIFSQHTTDMQNYTPLPEGIYVKGSDFLKLRPLKKNSIVTDADTNDLEFYGKLMNKKELEYYTGQKKEKILTDSIWGFVQNNTLYVNVSGKFYRVPVFGTISYFTAVVEVYNRFNSGMIDPVTGMSMQVPSRTRELREFIILPENDLKPVLYDHRKLEKYFREDSVVWKAYTSEPARKRNKYITRYIRMYNSLHPLVAGQQ